MDTTIATVKETNAVEIQRIFDLQKKHQFEVGSSSASERRAKLKTFHKAVLKYRPQIKEALYKDYRKHPSEVDLTEIYPITSVTSNMNLKALSSSSRLGIFQ